MSGVWLWLPGFGPIRTSTVITAVVMLGVITVVRRNPLLALVAETSWAGLFEIVYHVVGIVGYHWPPANFVWMTGALAGWIILAAVLGIWPDWRITLVFAGLMGLWITTGFHYNVPGQAAPISVGAEILNEAAKTTLALAYLIGALRAPRLTIRLGTLDGRTREAEPSARPQSRPVV